MERLRSAITAASSQEVHEADPAPIGVAIVGVHGLGRIQAGGFRDEFASGLQSYLNAREQVGRSGRRWNATIVVPRLRGKVCSISRNVVRLCRDDEADPNRPMMRFYDVYDGYWSNGGKGKGFVSLLGWLMKCTFFPRSSTARIPATWRKLMWDIGYLYAILFSIVLLTGIGVAAAQVALRSFTAWLPASFPFNGGSPGTTAHGDASLSVIKLITEPLSALGDLPPIATIQLFAAFLAAFLCIQLIAALSHAVARRRRTAELKQDTARGGEFEAQLSGGAKFHGLALAVMCSATILWIVYATLLLTFLHPDSVVSVTRFFVALFIAVAAWQSVRSISRTLVEQFRDVQTFTMFDSDSESGSRLDMIGSVRDAIQQPLSAIRGLAGPDDPAELYAHVHIAAHSLGSSIALDALAFLWQELNQGTITLAEWQRLRSFTTFGSTIEKTRFLRDSLQITINPQIRQSENDIYGKVFTADACTLMSPNNSGGIYWLNVSYFRDVLSNRIVSYRSRLMPGSLSACTSSHQRRLCDDRLLPNPGPLYRYVNDLYISDPSFWTVAGAVLTD